MTSLRINADERIEEDTLSGRRPSPRRRLSPHHRREGLCSSPHPHVISSPSSRPLHFDSVAWFLPCRFTLSRYDQASHAVRDTGASCQESDAHDDVWDPQCKTDHGYLKHRKMDTFLILTFQYSVLLHCATRGQTHYILVI